VSVKTARRDLEALAIAGIPVYSQPGKGGGWSLLGGARTDLSGLTADEARTLFLVAGPSSTATPEAKAALRKLVQALPQTFRAGAEAAAAAVVLDPAGWGGTARPRPTHLDALQRAVVDGVQVRLGYADRARSETERVVHPLGLVEKDSIWYLVADTANGMRTFRVSRVRGVSVRTEPAVRPPGFDLATTWADAGRSFDRDLRRYVVHALADGDRLHLLRHALPEPSGRQAMDSAGPPGPDGRRAVTIHSESLEVAHDELLRVGRALEVVDPLDLRHAIAETGRALAARHRSVGGPGSGPPTLR